MSESSTKIHPKGSLIFVMYRNDQKSITSNNTCPTVAISDIIIYEGLSFNIIRKFTFNKLPELARNVSKSYISPNINLTSKERFDVIHEQNSFF